MTPSWQFTVPRWTWSACACLAAMAAVGAAHGEATAGEGKVVRLEPVFVEASSADPWQYFRMPGFEVISHCPDEFNLIYARALQRATAARAALLPEDFWGKLATPIKIVLYNREPAAGNAFSQLKPIDLSWLSDDGAPAGPYSVQKSYPTMVGDGDTFINCGNYWNLLKGAKDFYIDPDSEILIRVRVPEFPGWFVAGLEGTHGLFSSRVIESGAPGQDFVVLPGMTWISRSETAALRKDPKRPRTLLPLAELFAGDVPRGDNEAWYAEAALFARWGLFRREADGRDHREAFLGFVRAAAGEPVTEPLFRRFFGMGYPEARDSLRDYVAEAVNEPIRLPIATPAEGYLEIRDATAIEVARIIGDWGRFEGRVAGLGNLEYQRECLDQADRLFERIYTRQTGDPLFLAAFGLYELQVGDEKRARQALEDATGSGVVRPRAYLELARMRLGNALPFAEEGIGDLGESEYADIIGLLAKARMQMPSLLGTYQLMARAMEHAPRKPSLGDMAALDAALRLFPRNASLAYKVATLYKRFGYPDQASAVISNALRIADSDEARARLAAFMVHDR